MSKITLTPLPLGDPREVAEQYGVRAVPDDDVLIMATYKTCDDDDGVIDSAFATVDGIPWTGRIEDKGLLPSEYELVQEDWLNRYYRLKP